MVSGTNSYPCGNVENKNSLLQIFGHVNHFFFPKLYIIYLHVYYNNALIKSYNNLLLNYDLTMHYLFSILELII